MSNGNIKPYVVTAKELLNRKITSVPMLLDPILQKHGLAALIGGSDTGKSYLMLEIALAICSSDLEVLDFGIKRSHGSAIYVSTEDDEDIMSLRIQGLISDRDLNAENVRFIFETDNVIKKINDELGRQPADIVIIDTLGDLFQGNINQGVEVRKFLMKFKQLAKDHKCLIIFLHHVSKSRETNLSPDKNDGSGSEALQSSCRLVLNLRKTQDGKRQLTVVKGNNIPDYLKGKGLVMDFDPKKGFSSTGQHVNFNGVGDITNGIPGYDPKLDEKIKTLYNELKSYQKVADALRQEGFKIDKNKVGMYVKRSSSNPENGEEMIDG